MTEQEPRLKTKEQLNIQVNNVSEALGNPIVPLSTGEELFNLTSSDLKEKFPARYDVYVDTLRRQKRNEEPSQLYARRIHALDALDKYINTYYSQNEEEKTLFDPQMNAFEALRKSIEEGITEGYIRLPTGSGKTVVFTEFVEATDLKTLIVVPTQILVDQTEERFEEFAPSTEIGKVYTQSTEYDKPVTITTYASFLKNVDTERINPEDYELLILDEAHKSLSPRRINAVNKFKNAIKLGFTATPRYTREKHVGNLLNTEVYTMGIRESVEQGILSPLSVYIAKTDVDLSDVRITSTGDYKDEDLERTINIATRNAAAVDLYKAMFLEQSAIAYCVSVKHAEDLAKRFGENGIAAGVVSGYQSRSEQQEMIEKFKSGETKVICNADILIEGFDQPHANVCLNLRPTASPVVAEQRAGRVLRLDPNNPFKHAYIVDFIDEFGNPNRFPVSLAQVLESAHVFRKDVPPDYPRYGTTGIGTVRYPQIEISGLKVFTDAEEVIKIVGEMDDKKYRVPDEGWLSLDSIWTKYRIAKNTVRRLTEPFRESHPEYFRVYKSNVGGKVSEHIAPELIEYVKNTRVNLPAPIEGWVHGYAIARELNVSQDTVRKLANEERQRNSNNFRVFKIDGGRVVEHYSPQLAQIIRSRLHSITAPEGWISYPDLAKKLKVTVQTARRLARKHKVSTPESFGIFRNNSGQMTEHVSTDLIKKLNEDRIHVPLPEEGWMSCNAIANELGTSQSVINRIADKHRKHNPEDFMLCKIEANGNIIEHFSPNLISLIRKERDNITEHEEGWIDYEDLAKQMDIKDKSTAAKTAEKYRSTYPQYFRLFTGENGKLTQFISPELVQLVSEERKNVPNREEGWLTRNQLYEELRIAQKSINRLFNELRKTNPEHFRLMRLKPNKAIYEHCSPQIVELIRNFFSNENN